MRFTTLFFDLDDTLYPSSSGLWQAIKGRMSQYMCEQLYIPEADVPTLREHYFKTYGTTVSAAANARYLEALAVVDDPAPAQRALDRLVQPVRDGHGRSSRPFNPATATDLALFSAVLRGEHTLHGFRNREIRTRLFGTTAATDRRRSAQVSRLVKRLHLRRLVAKIPRSRRWRVTQLGHAVLTAAIHLREEEFPAAFLKAAA